MSKIVLVAGEDPLDELHACVSTLMQFYGGMHSEPSLLPIGFSAADEESRVRAFLAGSLLVHRAFIFAVPASPLQHVYAEVVNLAFHNSPVGACAWVIHAEGSRETASVLESSLERRVTLFPHLRWTPGLTRAEVHVEALRFLNFSFTHCQGSEGGFLTALS